MSWGPADVEECVRTYLRDSDSQHQIERVLFLEASRGVVDGCCLLLFERGATEPRLVAKSARSEKGKAIFRTEHETLTRLNDIGMNADAPTTPLPLASWEKDGALVTLQTAVPGRLMKNIAGRELFSPSACERTAQLVLDWHFMLHRKNGKTLVTLGEQEYDERVRTGVEKFLRRFVLDEGTRRFVRKRCLDERPLQGLELPFLARHADFCTANMVLQDQNIGVFDWEFSLAPQLPLFDLFFFFSSTRFPYGGIKRESSHLASFIEVFQGRTYLNTALRSCLAAACKELEVPLDALPDLLLIALIETANLKYEALIEAHNFGGDPLASDAGSDEDRRKLWSVLVPGGRKDVPFACLQDGEHVTISHLASTGLPDLGAQA